MEFCEGSQVDDADYIKVNNIDPHDVAKKLGRIISEMIFIKGFLHAVSSRIFVYFLFVGYSSWQCTYPQKTEWKGGNCSPRSWSLSQCKRSFPNYVFGPLDGNSQCRSQSN